MLSSCAAPTDCFFALLLLLLVCYKSLARRAGRPGKKIDSQPCAAKLHRLRKIIMSTVKVSTTFGQITLKLRPDAAPKTVEHLPVHNSKCRGASPPI